MSIDCQTATLPAIVLARQPANRRSDLIGYTVGVVGGYVGRVDPATADADPRNLVVRTGRWGLRRRVLLPAGAVNFVNHLSRRVYLQGDRKMVSDAPRLDYAAMRPRSLVAPGVRLATPPGSAAALDS